jgi:Tfp pilus assembly protein PilF
MTVMKKVTAAALILLSWTLAAAADSGSSRLLAPVFPASPPGLAWVEGEDAISTNMATEPILNYGCSGNRSLQLSRTGQLPGGAAYYAEYAVYLERSGSYELWYGGTPPGSRDEFTLSFASPLSLRVDGGSSQALFREDVNVVERYSPAYYWVRTPALTLEAGAHVLRFEVSAKRRIDDRFFFYLDAFFLAIPEALAAAKADRSGLPPAFPADPADRRIDHPLRGIEDYQAQIEAKPAEVGPYIELADEYSLSGDYLGALKTLSKAMVVAPRNPDLRLLAAKNRIWRGDVREGIEAYGVYISLRPDDLGAYEEAGKIAAWSGRFSDSEYFYKAGLAAFPGNASLTVNLGLAQLWAGRVADADAEFAAAERAALAEADGASRLAAIYRDNGFPERAMAVYEKAIAAFPEHLGLYLDEGALLAAMGREGEEKALESRIAAAFEPSPELDAVLERAGARRRLKADRIAEFEARISTNPEDLDLRDELTRVYAWSGRRAEASRQLESIMAARFARKIADSDSSLAEVFAAQFSAAALRADADARLAAIPNLRNRVGSASALVDKSLVELRARERSAAAARAAGKVPGPVEAERAALVASLAGLASALSDLEAEDARLAFLGERASGLKASLEAASARDEADDQAFKALTAGLGWSFDAGAAAEELALPAARGEEIAALARARVLVTGKESKGAVASLARVGSEALAAAKLQAQLMVEARLDGRGLYRSAAESAGTELSPALAAAALELAGVASCPAPDSALTALASGPLPEADTEALEAYAATLRGAMAASISEDARLRGATGASGTLGAARGLLASIVQEASALEDRRLGRAWYAFESESLDLRSELGAYYDALGLPGQATRQYRRVLALDPSNIRAMHSLALAEEKAGDWAAAAALFKAVNAADPYYLNAAARYNDIARSHAPAFEASTGFLADTNLFDYHSASSALFPLGSFVALKPMADIRSIRDRNLGFPAYIGASFGLEAPLSLGAGADSGTGAGGLVLRPSLSLIATSADFSAGGIATITPTEFLGALSAYSAAGLGLDWAAGAWKGTGNYSYAPLPDSLNPAMSVLYAHRLELSASSYLPLGGAFRYLAPRLYASGAYVPEDGGNIYGSLLAELVPALRLSDSPWVNLGIPLDLIYEDSRVARTSPYYAADQAITAKGGLLWQSSHTLKEGDSLSMSLEGMGGLYMTRSFSTQPTAYPYLYALARLDWLRPDATYFLSLEASATDPFKTAPQYWSFSILGGVSARQPRLITP